MEQGGEEGEQVLPELAGPHSLPQLHLPPHTLQAVLPLAVQALGDTAGYNFVIYQARESSLVPAGFLSAQFLQSL